MHLQSFWLYGTHCVKQRWLKKILLLNKTFLKCTTSSLPWCNKLLRYIRFDVTQEHYSHSNVGINHLAPVVQANTITLWSPIYSSLYIYMNQFLIYSIWAIWIKHVVLCWVSKNAKMEIWTSNCLFFLIQSLWLEIKVLSKQKSYIASASLA